jgi:hypothetical protein
LRIARWVPWSKCGQTSSSQPSMRSRGSARSRAISRFIAQRVEVPMKSSPASGVRQTRATQCQR